MAYIEEELLIKIGRPRTSKGLATFCAKIADQKIADNIIVMDLTGIEIASTDYFVICTCESDAQIKGLITAIDRKCKELKVQRPKIEGTENLQWVLLDFFDVVMHIMLPDIRNFYKLEKLWGDAKFYALSDSGKLKTADMRN